MQLRHYFAILRRFWLLVVMIPLAVGAISLALELAKPPLYGATAKLMVSQAPQLADPAAPFPDINLNYSWESSEFILDDLPQVVTSAAFADDVSALLASQGVAVDPCVVQSGLRAENFHRSVTLSASAASPETTLAVLNGAITSLQTNGLNYWSRGDAEHAGLSIAVLDPPGVAAATNTPRRIAVNVGARVGLALAAAVGLAFLLYYLDDRLRDPQQAEQWVGVPIIGVIPKE